MPRVATRPARLARLLSPLALLFSLAPAPCPAGLIQFEGPQPASLADGNLITLGADGALSGSLAIASIASIGLGTSAPASLPVVDGVLTFRFGPVVGGSRTDGY